jgi:hypothetical protein
VPGGGDAADVGADLGHHDLRGALSDAGDRGGQRNAGRERAELLFDRVGRAVRRVFGVVADLLAQPGEFGAQLVDREPRIFDGLGWGAIGRAAIASGTKVLVDAVEGEVLASRWRMAASRRWSGVRESRSSAGCWLGAVSVRELMLTSRGVVSRQGPRRDRGSVCRT